MQGLDIKNLHLYSISEVAKVLGVGKRSIYKLIDEGKIGFITLSTQKKISKTEIERFIRENTTQGIKPQKEEPRDLIVTNNCKPTEEIFSTMWKEFINGKRIL